MTVSTASTVAIFAPSTRPSTNNVDSLTDAGKHDFPVSGKKDLQTVASQFVDKVIQLQNATMTDKAVTALPQPYTEHGTRVIAGVAREKQNTIWSKDMPTYYMVRSVLTTKFEPLLLAIAHELIKRRGEVNVAFLASILPNKMSGNVQHDRILATTTAILEINQVCPEAKIVDKMLEAMNGNEAMSTSVAKAELFVWNDNLPSELAVTLTERADLAYKVIGTFCGFDSSKRREKYGLGKVNSNRQPAVAGSSR